MKILFCNRLDHLWEKAISDLRNRFPSEEINVLDSSTRSLGDAEAVVAGRLDPGLIEEASALKHYIVPWTGVNFLPFELLKSKGISIYNAHGNTQLVAERVLGMLLGLLGRICEFDRDIRNNIWHRSGEIEDDWDTLYYKTVGFAGAGAIARNTAALLQPFECGIYYLRRRPVAENETKDLETLIKRSQIIVLAVPLTPQTKGLINLHNMDLLRGKYLVNVSRGEVIEEEALYRMLDEGIIKGAAIDTWYNYPSREKSITPVSLNYDFAKFQNKLLMSPHAAMHTELGHIRDIEGTIQNIEAIIKGDLSLASLVNHETMY